MATLNPFFGPHNGELKIYVANFAIGVGAFKKFTNFEAGFSGSYNTFFQVHPLNLMIRLSDQNANVASGPCQITVNEEVDDSATYKTRGKKITFNTRLARTPIDVYKSQGGTQIDGLEGHNAWIG